MKETDSNNEVKLRQAYVHSPNAAVSIHQRKCNKDLTNTKKKQNYLADAIIGAAAVAATTTSTTVRLMLIVVQFYALNSIV